MESPEKLDINKGFDRSYGEKCVGKEESVIQLQDEMQDIPKQDQKCGVYHNPGVCSNESNSDKLNDIEIELEASLDSNLNDNVSSLSFLEEVDRIIAENHLEDSETESVLKICQQTIESEENNELLNVNTTNNDSACVNINLNGSSHDEESKILDNSTPVLPKLNMNSCQEDKSHKTLTVLKTVETHTLKEQNLSLENSKTIGGSTITLSCVNTKDNLSKTFSKSLENLNAPDTEKCSIDKEKILAEFDSQKIKVSLPVKLVEEQKFPRSHKEIITQDFGSIVKNVHGIFSSVSGSLKHAYMSQKIPAQPIKINRLLTSTSLKNASNENNKITENIENSHQKEETTSVASVSTDGNKDFSISEEDKIEMLERALMNERLNAATLKDGLKQKTDEIAEKEREKKELETKLEALRKRLESCEREKNNAVMQYAVSESAVIGAREAAETARRSERAARAETDTLTAKLRGAREEKQRICIIYDEKCQELTASQREAAKLKEDLKECEGRLKWTQNKLRTETEAYREAIGNVERLNSKVSELENARSAAAVNMADATRAKQLESDLKQAQASLILYRHEREEIEKKLTSTGQQLETCQRQLSEATAAIDNLNRQVGELTLSNQRLEEEAAELASLRARAALADTLTHQLERETERAARAEEAAARELARAETCARREASALEHAARLTAEHVEERALSRQHDNTVRALSIDNASLREQISSAEAAATEARSKLVQEASRRNEECALLAAKVAELTKELEHSTKRLEWEKGENEVLKKKHASSVKELNRELQRALKRCEQLESRAASEQHEQLTPTDLSLRRGLSAGSMSSLSSADTSGPTQATETEGKVNGHSVASSSSEAQTKPPSLEPDRQALIERIVQLQRANARRAERCDFLEEHGRQLTAELKRKSRLVRELLTQQPAGALSSETADNNKREVARLGGGAMAAVWGGAPDGITLQLSLEMNNKLQGLLEDTLLKNITLKKNLETLGEEIARLKSQAKDKT